MSDALKHWVSFHHCSIRVGGFIDEGCEKAIKGGNTKMKRKRGMVILNFIVK
jgi:hypothetical protein